MRVYWRAAHLISIAIFATSIATSASAAQCGDLKIATSLDLKTLPSGRPAVDVLVGTTPEVFLIDTGGVASMVTSQLVDELKLTVTRTTDGSRLVRVNGASSDQMAKLPSITVGRFRQEGAYFAVYPPGANPEFTGIIAPDFLQHFDIDFDFAQKKLNLISPDHCAGKVVYWTAPKVATVPMRIDRGGHITFQMTLDGKKVGAMIDTGATTTTLNLDVARRVFNVDVNAPDVQKVGELKGGYTTNVYQRRFKTLAAEGVEIGQPMITLLPDLVSGAVTSEARPTGSLVRDDVGLPSIILGMDTLQKLHLYIAYNERKVYMTAGGSAPAQ
jgi:predicted aspartyl protease